MMPFDNPDIDPVWPPGTVRIDGAPQSEQAADLILQPKPTHDPNDPLNWPQWRKHLNFALVSYYVLMVFAFIDVLTVTWGPIHRDLGISYPNLNNSYAAGCGCLCIGSVLFIPFALKYGRRPIYLFSTAVQCGMSAWSARMQTVTDIMLVNVFSCLVGALSEVLAQMTVADLYFVHERGLMNSAYVWTMMVGIDLSPLAGGYVVESQGWRWVWWWMVILFGGGLMAFLFFYEETKYAAPGGTIEGHPVSFENDSQSPKGKEKEDIEAALPADSKKEPHELQQKQHLQSLHWVDTSIPQKPYNQKLKLWTPSPTPLTTAARHSYEPFIMLATIPALLFMSLVYGAMTAASNVTVTTLSSWMTKPPYNFNASQIGLMGIPPFVGTTIGVMISGPLSDRLILSLARRNEGVFEPEMRLWMAVVFVPFVPAGLLMFGVGLNDERHWALLAVGLGVVAFGTVPPSSVALTYLTDAYEDIIADSLVGVTFIRNLISTIFVFVLSPWIARSGIAGFYIAFSVILTVILSGNLIFIFWGKRMRFWTAGRYLRYSREHRDIRGE